MHALNSKILDSMRHRGWSAPLPKTADPELDPDSDSDWLKSYETITANDSDGDIPKYTYWFLFDCSFAFMLCVSKLSYNMSGRVRSELFDTLMRLLLCLLLSFADTLFK